MVPCCLITVLLYTSPPWGGDIESSARAETRSPVVVAGGPVPGSPGHAGAPADCPPDSVKSGALCVDKHEASVWSIPGTNTNLVESVQQGTATLSDLTAGGATQHGCRMAPFNLRTYPATFPSDSDRDPLYAVSVPGVLPSTCLTWAQARVACALSTKRLPTVEEWGQAAGDTPRTPKDDETTGCNVSGPPYGPTETGARPACVSRAGAYDMVGNVWEWVEPGSVLRGGTPACGGDWYGGTHGGPSLDIFLTRPLGAGIGFRCVR